MALKDAERDGDFVVLPEDQAWVHVHIGTDEEAAVPQRPPVEKCEAFAMKFSFANDWSSLTQFVEG